MKILSDPPWPLNGSPRGLHVSPFPEPAIPKFTWTEANVQGQGVKSSLKEATGWVEKGVEVSMGGLGALI